MTVTIREAVEADSDSMREIYRPYVETTAVSFETDVPSVEEFRTRVRRYIEGWACIVAEFDGDVVGYAYGSEHRARSAYRWSVETTVYVAPDHQRTGVGRKLYQVLLPRLAEAGFCNAYAGTTLPNPGSVGLHLAVGFTPVGVFSRVGNKFGRWHDVSWFQKPLRDSRICDSVERWR